MLGLLRIFSRNFDEGRRSARFLLAGFGLIFLVWPLSAQAFVPFKMEIPWYWLLLFLFVVASPFIAVLLLFILIVLWDYRR